MKSFKVNVYTRDFRIHVKDVKKTPKTNKLT